MGTILWSVLGSVLGSVIGLIMRSVIRSVSTDYHSQHIKNLKEQTVTRLLLWSWVIRIWVCKMPRLIYKSNAEMNRWNLTPIESITFWRMIVTWTDLVTDHNHRWWIKKNNNKKNTDGGSTWASRSSLVSPTVSSGPSARWWRIFICFKIVDFPLSP